MTLQLGLILLFCLAQTLPRNNGRSIKVVALENCNIMNMNEAKILETDLWVPIGVITILPNTTWAQLDNTITEALKVSSLFFHCKYFLY